MIEIAPELPGGDHRLQLAVRRRNHPHVDRHFALVSHGEDPALLQCPEQLPLQRQGQLGDLVQEERAAVRRAEQAGAVAAGASKATLAMAEQLGLGQVGADRGAVERHERSVGSPGIQLVQGTGQQFLAKPDALQREAFGNAALMVVCKDLGEVEQVVARLHGSLTGSIYGHTAGEDDAAYATIEPILRLRAGRLLNDKMPTGVAVSPAMNHGGPFPATGHSGFTSVGFPASLRRFTMLACYDNVRLERLPPELRMPGEKV